MTSAQFKAIADRHGRTTASLARTLRVNERTVRRYIEGTREIPGPVAVIMELVDEGNFPPF